MKRQNLVGKQFGVYQVLELDKELTKIKKASYWKCQCSQCKNITSVRKDGLNRLPKECPQCKYYKLIGKRFGQLTVIKQGKIDSNGHIYWICQCDCGNIKEISGTHLTSNMTVSCGCRQKSIGKLNLIDLTGQKFGKLTVLNRATPIGERPVKWNCLCDCGNMHIVSGANLKNGTTTSCGCIKSKGEYYIRQFLLQNNITFKIEYVFPDLPNRRFDFGIIDNDTGTIKQLIEFDGIQHSDQNNHWYSSIEEFKTSQQRDEEKNQYCKEHSIPLLRIRYDDNIEEKLKKFFKM